MNSAVTTTACSRCAAPLSPELPGALCPDCFSANLFADTLSDPGAAESAQAGLRRIGDYELGAELGRGGMGVVYRARQISLNRPAAVKLILTGPLASAVERQRFLAEAEAAAALEHPGIVSIYEAGEDGGQPFFAMQLIEGESLSARMRQAKGPLPPREAALLMLRTAQAVQHAHERGFLHRDLKPANILLSGDGTPHVTDFGLARRVDSDAHLTLTGAAIGTPSYMAPEQTDTRQPPTTAVDVYSLGAILYEMLSGHPPFRADSLAELFVAIREREPVSLSGVRSVVDRDLDIICRKCLEKEPARRYRSAQSFADDLQHWLNGEPIAARAAGKTERLWRWCRRRPALASLAAACVLLLLTVAVGSSIAAWKIKASRDAERTQLRAALVAQAQAGRSSGVAGARSRGLKALRRAAEIGTDAESRDELIAHLALFDVERVTDRPVVTSLLSRSHHADVTPAFDFSVRGRTGGELSFHTGFFGGETGLWSPPARRSVERVAFRPDGKVLAVQVTGPVVLLLDTASRQTLATIEGAWFSTWSPDGAVFIIWERGNKFFFHDGRTFARLGGVQGGHDGQVACNPLPGSTQAAIPGKDKVIIGDWALNKQLTTIAAPGFISALAWQGDILTAGTNSGQVWCWNFATGVQVTLTPHQDRVGGLVTVPGRNLLFTRSWDATSNLLDVQAGKVLARSKDIYPHLAHQNGRDLLAGNGEAVFPARVETPESCLAIDLPERGEKSLLMDFSPDGRWLLAVSDGGYLLHLYEPATGRRFLVPLPFTVKGAKFSAESTRVLLVRPDAVWALELKPGPQGPVPSAPVRLGDLPGGAFDSGSINAPRTRLVLGSDRDGVVLFYVEQPEGAAQRILPDTSPGTSRCGCSFSADGEWLAMGSFHGEGLRLWHLPAAQEGPLLATVNGHAFFSPDGRRLLYTSQPVLRLFETGTWKPLGEIRNGSHTDYPGSACWHPDSRHLAVVRESRVVDLWDTVTLTVKATLTPHPEMTLNVSTFSADGRFLAAGTSVRRVLLWDLAHLAGELAAAGTPLDFPVKPVSTALPPPELLPRRCFPPRPAGLDPRCLDLSAHYNQFLELESPAPATNPRSVLPLPPGTHRLEGTDFDARGLLRLANASDWRQVPSRVRGLRVDQPCRRLHLLHAFAYQTPPGTTIASLRIHYAKGDPVTVPLRAGQEVEDFWNADRQPEHATLAWRGANAINDKIALWKYTWENPRPDDTVTALDLESAMNEGGLMVAAITVE